MSSIYILKKSGKITTNFQYKFDLIIKEIASYERRKIEFLKVEKVKGFLPEKVLPQSLQRYLLFLKKAEVFLSVRTGWLILLGFVCP